MSECISVLKIHREINAFSFSLFVCLFFNSVPLFSEQEGIWVAIRDLMALGKNSLTPGSWVIYTLTMMNISLVQMLAAASAFSKYAYIRREMCNTLGRMHPFQNWL